MNFCCSSQRTVISSGTYFLSTVAMMVVRSACSSWVMSSISHSRHSLPACPCILFSLVLVSQEFLLLTYNNYLCDIHRPDGLPSSFNFL